MNLSWPKKKPASVQSDRDLSSEFILGAVEDGVVMIGNDRLLHIFNRAASELTGWPVSEALGLEHRSVLVFTDSKGKPLAPEESPVEKVLRSNESYRNNSLMIRSRNNKLTPISLLLSPVAAGGNITNVVGVFRDITTEKAEEEQRSDFISTASHEMRTPIAAIEGYLALALNPKVSKVDDHAKNYLEKAHNATQHLGELFQDLLTSTKAEDGRLSSFPVVVELGEIVQQIADASRFAAQKKGLQLRYTISSYEGGVNSHRTVRPLFYVHVDPNRIREVLQNLIDNAVKYTVEGSVSISLTGNDTVAQVQIKDSGQGIAEEDIPHLFQKFYRVDNSMTRSIGGTGLGLFICRRILQLYNGQIWVESQLGKGSTFFINLPRLNSEQALELQRREAATTSPLGPTTA